jgi:hypothetical protein
VNEDSGPPYLLPAIPPPQEPDEAINWMNARHFVVRESGKTTVITEETDPVLRRRMLTRSSFADIRNLYLNQFVDVLDKRGNRKNLAGHWLTDSRRRQYEGIVCAPGQQPVGYYNLWQGFSVKPRQGDWSLMDAHIRENICANDAEVYRYVRKWLAFAVKHPSRLPEVGLVLRGKQGTGKGVFARGFGALFGQHFLHISQARHLAGHFNAHLEDAIVVFADEAFLAGDKQAEGTLKMLVTEPEIVIERKGKDFTRSKNLIHLIVASNNDWVIPAAAEERRFCVLDVCAAHIQDHEYFDAIVQQMDHGGREAMLFDLMRENLTSFNVRQFPMTTALQDQKFRSMDEVTKWWFEKLQDGCLLPGDKDWEGEVERDALVQDLHTVTGRKDSSQDVRNHLVKMLPDGYPKDGPRRATGEERKRTWVVPALTECRTKFERVHGGQYSWPKEGR